MKKSPAIRQDICSIDKVAQLCILKAVFAPVLFLSDAGKCIRRPLVKSGLCSIKTRRINEHNENSNLY